MPSLRRSREPDAPVIRYLLFTALTVAIGLSCYHLGQRGARAFERMLVQRVANGLDVLELGWARVEADGLKLRLYGHAPDLAARDLALDSARDAAPMARVTSYATATLAPPEHRDPVRVELLRDARGVTLTGQTASRGMRDRAAESLAADGPDLNVEDLTGIQAAQPRRGLGAEIGVASLAASRLPNAYVVMEPGRVTIDGQAADEADRERLTRALLDRAGDKVALVLDIRIPPQVIAPFAFSAYKDAGAGIRLERCAARNLDEQAALLDRLTGAGVAHRPEPCPVGLGGPGGDWAAAVTAGLQALAALPAGRFDIEYRDARLTGAPPTSVAELGRAEAAFRDALPDGFAGAATLREPDAARIGRERFWMRLTRDPDGVALNGRVGDAAAKRSIETEAAALFGADRVESALTAGPRSGGAAPPPGWETAALRILGYLEATAEGEADLAGDRLSLSGRVLGPETARVLHDRALAELPGYRVETALVVDLPAALRSVPMPPARCAAELNRVNRDPTIDFATGSADLTAGSEAVLDALADILARCTGGAIVAGGHTDAQGSEEVNRRISQARAEAVAAALAMRGVPPGRIVATGFGEERPIASNESAAGRARNRRIEFEPAG